MIDGHHYILALQSIWSSEATLQPLWSRLERKSPSSNSGEKFRLCLVEEASPTS